MVRAGTDAYSGELAALTALCGASAGQMLTCRGTFDIGASAINLTSVRRWR